MNELDKIYLSIFGLILVCMLSVMIGCSNEDAIQQAYKRLKTENDQAQSCQDLGKCLKAKALVGIDPFGDKECTISNDTIFVGIEIAKVHTVLYGCQLKVR